MVFPGPRLLYLWLGGGSTNQLEHFKLEVVSKLLGHAIVAVTERAYAALFDSTARNELLLRLATRY